MKLLPGVWIFEEETIVYTVKVGKREVALDAPMKVPAGVYQVGVEGKGKEETFHLFPVECDPESLRQ